MELDKTKVLLEQTRQDTVNECLKVGWVHTSQYVTDAGEPGRRHETMHYVLAWQREGEPVYPKGSKPYSGRYEEDR